MKQFFSIIDVNAPVVIGFTALSLIALVLGTITGGLTNQWFFSVYRSSWSSPMTYVRLVTHVFGHVNLEHFMGNIMLLLVIGPLLEEKYGGVNLCIMIIVTALVTGLVNVIFFPQIRLLGASGVVFAMILASSFTSVKEGTIPLTFLMVAVVYIGREVYSAIFVQDSISQLTHILGGGVGAILASYFSKL